jgi:gliding motility-associated-like protein
MMKKIYFFCLFFSFGIPVLLAQKPFFQKQISNSIQVLYNSISPTADAGCLISGRVVDGQANSMPWMSKFNANGALEWSKKLSLPSGNLISNGISCGIELKNGNYVICCSAYFKESIIFMVDKSFNILWSYKVSFPNAYTEFYNAVELKNGNIAFGGTQITVLSPSGNLVWSKNYVIAGSKETLLNRTMLETQGGDLVLGYVILDNLQVTKTKKIIRLNSTNGNLVWERDFDTVNNGASDFLESTFEDNFGSLYFMIYSGQEVSVYKITFLGNILWRKKYANIPFPITSASLSQKKDKTLTISLMSLPNSYYLNINENGDITSQFKENLNYSFAFKSITATDNNLISIINAGYKCGNVGGQTDNQLFLTKRKPNGENACTSPTDLKSVAMNLNQNALIKSIKEETILPILPFSNLIISDYVVKVSNENSNCTDTTYINRCEGDFYTLDKVTYKDNGVYKATLKGYCDSLVLLKINYLKKSESKIDTTICEGKSIVFNQKKYTKAGVYTEKFKNKLGCDSIVTIQLGFKGLSFSVPDSIRLNQGESAEINIESQDIGNKYQWSPPDFLKCTDCIKNVTKPSESITYTVKSTNSVGCELSKNIVVSVFKEANTFVPNVFSPNDDGINENFTLFANESIKLIKNFVIYDRWGNHIFETQNILPNDSNLGWNGFYKNQKVQQGVYTYKIEIELNNGKTEILKGDVMVN